MRTSQRRGLSAIAALALIVGSVALATPANAASWGDDPLISPANNSIISANTVTLNWAGTSNSAGYRVSYGLSGGGATYSWYNTSPTAYPVPLYQGDGWYFWYVSYRTCSFCSYSTSSGTHYFYVDTMAPVVNLGVNATEPIAPGTPVVVTGQYFDNTTMSSATVSLDGGRAEGFSLSGTSIDTTGLTTGTHTLTVVVRDTVGWTGTKSIDFEVDADAPIVTNVLPATGTHLRPVDFLYSADLTGQESWQLSVDGGAQLFTAGDLAAGLPIDADTWADASTHDLTLTARDHPGNVTTSVTTVTVDATGPLLTIDAPVDGSLLAGWPAVSGTVTDATGVQTIQVTAQRFTAGACGTVVWSASPTVSGNTWQRLVPALADGTYCVKVTATDLLGNSSEANSQVSLDQTAPSAFATISPDGWVVHSGVFGWQPSTDANGVTYTLFVDDGTSTAEHPVTSGASLALDLVPGDYEWWVRATDPAGNTTTTSRTTLQVIGAPVLAAPDAGAVFTDDLAIAWTSAVHAPGGVAAFEVEFAHGDDTFVTEVDADQLQLLQSFAADLPDGAWTIRVRAVYTDLIAELGSRRGEWSEPVAVTRDTTAPTVDFDSPTDGAALSSWSGAGGSLADAGGIQSVALEFHQVNAWDGSCGALIGSPLAAGFDADSWWANDSPGDGTYCLRVIATDRAGNTTGRELTVTLDATAPAAFEQLGPQGWTVRSGIFSWQLSSDAHGVTYTINVDDGTGAVEYAVSSGTSRAIDLAPGHYVWWVDATDSFGNVTSTTHTDLDVIGVPRLEAPASASSFASQLGLEWTGDVHAPGGVDHWQVEFVHEGGTSFITDVDAVDLELLQSFASELPEGQWAVHVRAVYGSIAGGIDSVNGEWSLSVLVTRDVSDPATPVLTSPADGTTQASYDLAYRWSLVAGADFYEFRASPTATVDDTGRLVDGGSFDVDGVLFEASASADGIGWWQVRSVDAAGNVSAWTSPWKLIVDHAYVAPKPPAPPAPGKLGATDPSDEKPTEPTAAPEASETAEPTAVTTTTDDGTASGSGDPAAGEDPTDPGFPVLWVVLGGVIVVVGGIGFFLRFLFLRRP